MPVEPTGGVGVVGRVVTAGEGGVGDLVDAIQTTLFITPSG